MLALGRNLMNRKLCLATAGFALLGCMATFAKATEPPSYPLLCRGGPSMELSIKYGVDDRPEMTIAISFRRGGAAATRGLGEGECTWSDRGMNRQEPSRLQFTTSDLFPVVLIGPGDRFRFTPFAKRGRGSPIQLVRAAENLVSAAREGREFQVHAYTREDRLIVTRIGP